MAEMMALEFCSISHTQARYKECNVASSSDLPDKISSETVVNVCLGARLCIDSQATFYRFQWRTTRNTHLAL